MSAGVSFLRARAVFLWILFLIPPASVFGHALAPGRAVFKGHDLGIVVALALTVLAILAWLPYQRQGRWSGISTTFLGLMAAAWCYQVVRTQLDQTLFNLSAFVVPIALALVWSKRASMWDLRIAVLITGYALISISVASLILGKFGWMPDGFAVTDGGEGRFKFLSWIGIPGRWGGPFESVNYASPIGGFLVMLGATQRGWHRWLLVAGGLLVLALGQGRTAMFAVVAGLLVVVLWDPGLSRFRHRSVIRAAVVALAILATTAYLVLLDPTFNGRTPIWSNFLGLLPSNPVFGVGDSGINAFVVAHDADPAFVPHVHAHGVVIDGLVRFGLVMAVLAIAIYIVAVVSAIRDLRRSGNPGPLAIVVFVITAGLTETLHGWQYWSVYSVALIWAVLTSESLAAPSDDEEAASVSWMNA